MRTNEYYHVLSRDLGDGFRIESIETETDFGTTHYEWSIYYYPEVADQLNHKEWKEFRKEGIAPFLDKKGVVTESSFDDAIRIFFWEQYDAGKIS